MPLPGLGGGDGACLQLLSVQQVSSDEDDYNDDDDDDEQVRGGGGRPGAEPEQLQHRVQAESRDVPHPGDRGYTAGVNILMVKELLCKQALCIFVSCPSIVASPQAHSLPSPL